MSIIIRLQNLPLNAKSGDIRKFFGGLRIPDGGVHILGGDKGDAFIAFMSDEDGRLAMRKDGGKIKDSRVKLFLSSHMEMQHEVEKLTKSSLVDAPSSKTSSKSHSCGDEVIRGRSSEKRRHSRSRSPYNYRDWSIDKARTVNEYRQRSRSPIGERIYSSKRSPKRQSRSPKRHVTSLRSSSSEYRSVKQEKMSLSPEVGSSLVHEIESESKSSDQQSVSKSQLQAELERRITEELEKSDIYRMIIGDDKPPDWNVGGFNMSVKEDFPFNIHQPYQQSYAYERELQNLMPFQPSYDVDRQFESNNFNPRFSVEGSKSEQNVTTPMRKTFFVLLSGLDPQWNYKKVQMILKGFFAPQGHIKFEMDRKGYKTGRVVVKVANKDDYDNILKIEEVTTDDHKIKLSKCNFALIKKLFPLERMNKNFDKFQDFCYILKGIPFACRYDNVVQFFQGYDVADIVILYQEDGRATGTGFVCFKTKQDFEGAFSQNGKKIFHRYIEMLPCSLSEMIEAKNKCNTFNSPVFNSPSFNSPSFNSPSFNSPPFNSPPFNSPSFTPYSTLMSEKRLPMTGRPLCALLTGLPPKTTAKKICKFFSKSDLNPDAIHLTVNNKRLSDGRAFVEFSNFRDFDAALKFHGEKLDDNIICVKQILYDEMIKILDAQKARHHFNTPAPAVPALNVPERVPYLWEPPDAVDNPSKPKRDDSFKGASFDNSEIKRYRFQDELVSPSFHFRQNEKPFNLNEKPTFNEYFNSYDKRDSYSNPAEIFPSSTIPQNNDLNMYERMLLPEGLTKEHFRIDSNKNVDISMKISELFDSFKKYEDNIKTSRLSPDNEAALLNFLNIRKSSDFDANERRSKSPDRKKRSYYMEDSLERTEYKKDKIYKSSPSEDSRSRDEMDNRHYDVWKADSLSGSFLPDRIESEKKSVGCVVHISNVSISAGTGDLENFLKGFDYFENTVIRRYTDTNEPTNDVRVTFLSRREAERAVRVLDKHYLHNMAVRLNIL